MKRSKKAVDFLIAPAEALASFEVGPKPHLAEPRLGSIVPDAILLGIGDGQYAGRYGLPEAADHVERFRELLAYWLVFVARGWQGWRGA